MRSTTSSGRRLGVDLVEEVALGVEPLERRRLLPIDREPPPGGELVVVGASLERGATDVAELVLRRWLELRVVGPAAVRARVAAHQPPDRELAADRELQDRRERLLGRLERPLQRLGLGDGPREPVEDESLVGVGLLQPVHHHRDDDVVRDVLAAIHVRACLDPELRPPLHVVAQDVAGRDLRDARSARRAGRPCVPFPAPGGPSSTSRIGLSEEALVVTHQQLRLDLLHRLEGDAHRDQDRRTAERELLDAPRGEHDGRDQARSPRGRSRPAARSGSGSGSGSRRSAGPGRMPGMNPPFFRRLSAVRVGSNWIAV